MLPTPVRWSILRPMTRRPRTATTTPAIRPSGRDVPSADRVRLTVRLLPALMKRLRAYAFITDRSHQELTEAALEQFLRDMKLSPEHAKQIKVMLG
jgi:hypothetical protein